MRWPKLLPILLLAAACGDDGPSDNSDLLIEAVGPAEVLGVPLDTLAAPLEVRVTDTDRRAVAGVEVTWSTDDGGVLTPESAQTDEFGFARARWKLGASVGAQEARASAGDGQTVTFTAGADAFRAVALSIGDAAHQCGITAEGSLFCWGENDDGQLGNGSATPSKVPVEVGLLETFRQVVTGEGQVGEIAGVERASSGGGLRHAGDPFTENDDYTCALTTNGEVFCWGGNDAGQLGNGTRLGSPQPVRPQLPAGVFISISTNRGGVCAVEQGGDAYCWGANYEGRLGLGHRDLVQTVPARVVADFPWRQIALGDDRACGVREGGQVYCWGGRPEWLGIDEDTATVLPLTVANSPSLESVTLSGWHQCGLTSAGIAHCWGANHNIGFETTDEVIPYPTPLDGQPVFQSLHSIFAPTFGLGGDGKGYWWGPPPRATGGGPEVPEPFSGDIVLSALGTNENGPCGAEKTTGVVFCWSPLEGFDMDRVSAVPPLPPPAEVRR
jgi:hypothetical protein